MFVVNNLEIFFGDLIIARAICNYIVIVLRITLGQLTIVQIKEYITNIRRYFVIQNTTLMFCEEVAASDNKVL